MFNKKRDAELKDQNSQIIGLLTTLNQNLALLCAVTARNDNGKYYIRTGGKYD